MYHFHQHSWSLLVTNSRSREKLHGDETFTITAVGCCRVGCEPAGIISACTNPNFSQHVLDSEVGLSQSPDCARDAAPDSRLGKRISLGISVYYFYYSV